MPCGVRQTIATRCRFGRDDCWLASVPPLLRSLVLTGAAASNSSASANTLKKFSRGGNWSERGHLACRQGLYWRCDLLMRWTFVFRADGLRGMLSGHSLECLAGGKGRLSRTAGVANQCKDKGDCDGAERSFHGDVWFVLSVCPYMRNPSAKGITPSQNNFFLPVLQRGKGPPNRQCQECNQVPSILFPSITFLDAPSYASGGIGTGASCEGIPG